MQIRKRVEESSTKTTKQTNSTATQEKANTPQLTRDLLEKSLAHPREALSLHYLLHRQGPATNSCNLNIVQVCLDKSEM